MAKYGLRQDLYLAENIESGDGILFYGLKGDFVTIQEVEPEELSDGIYVKQTYIVYVHGKTGRNIRVSEHQLKEKP